MAILGRFNMTLLNSPSSAVNIQVEVKTEYVEADEKRVQVSLVEWDGRLLNYF